MKKLIALAVVAFFAFTGVCLALSVTGKKGTMLREGPNGKKVQQLTKGTSLEFTGKKNNKWIEVKTMDGKMGWVHSKNTDFMATSKKAAKKSYKSTKAKASTKAKKVEPAKKKVMGESEEEINTEMSEDEDL